MKTNYASMRIRLFAQVFNLLLLLAVLAPLVYLFNYFLQPSVHQHLLYGLFSMLRSMLLFVITVAGMAWFTHRFGGSPGKCLLGLKVLNQKDGSYLNLAQALTRTVLAIISMASIIGVLFIFFDGQRRGLHDRLMGTVVVDQDDDYADIVVDAAALEELLHNERT